MSASLTWQTAAGTRRDSNPACDERPKRVTAAAQSPRWPSDRRQDRVSLLALRRRHTGLARAVGCRLRSS